jgi:hypothetical protein
MSISTNRFTLDGQNPTITAFGYEISWLNSYLRENEGRPVFERELLIERLSDGRTWHWTKRLGRWTSLGNDILDGWVCLH